MKRLVKSAFADEYADDLGQQIDVLKKNDIDYIELRFINGKNIVDISPKEMSEIKKELQANGIEVSALGSPIGKINLTDDFDRHLEKVKAVFEAASILDVKNVRIFSFYCPENVSKADCKESVFEKLEKILKLSESYEITLCHENEALIYGEGPENCKEILDYFQGKMRCVFDMGNFVLDGYDPLDAYLLLYDYIEYFHIKDALHEGAIVPAGKGEAKIGEILKDYTSRKGKNVFVTLEPHLQTFSGLNALKGKDFINPYQYADQQSAFLDAIKHFNKIVDFEK